MLRKLKIGHTCQDFPSFETSYSKIQLFIYFPNSMIQNPSKILKQGEYFF